MKKAQGEGEIFLQGKEPVGVRQGYALNPSFQLRFTRLKNDLKISILFPVPFFDTLRSLKEA